MVCGTTGWEKNTTAEQGRGGEEQDGNRDLNRAADRAGPPGSRRPTVVKDGQPVSLRPFPDKRTYEDRLASDRSVRRFCSTTRTRIRPPRDVVKLEDRLHYLLQPPLPLLPLISRPFSALRHIRKKAPRPGSKKEVSAISDNAWIPPAHCLYIFELDNKCKHFNRFINTHFVFVWARTLFVIPMVRPFTKRRTT